MVILVGALLLSIVGVNLLSFLPIALLRALQPPFWVNLAIVFVLFVWCFGED
jgi:hypothetical protein